MNVLVRARDGFTHGEHSLQRGQQVVMDEATARDLGKLVEVVGAVRETLVVDPVERAPLSVELDRSLAPRPAAIETLGADLAELQPADTLSLGQSAKNRPRAAR